MSAFHPPYSRRADLVGVRLRALAYDLFDAVALTAFAVAVALAAIWAGA